VHIAAKIRKALFDPQTKPMNIAGVPLIERGSEQRLGRRVGDQSSDFQGLFA
jgi:hypothetical protein